MDDYNFMSNSPECLDEAAVPLLGGGQVEHLREGLPGALHLGGRHAVQPPEVGQRLRDGELGVQRQILEMRA